jgi:4-amino-4-deoxy-L-arabinose transferase-like glycosyltransferase
MRMPEAVTSRMRGMAFIGLFLTAAGLFLPAELISGLFRGGPASEPNLALGALLFKGSLCLLGLHLALCSRLARPSPEIDREAQKQPWARWALGAILILAVGLRLPALGEGLWLDEILTHVNYARLPFASILSTYASENQHFLFSLMAHASYLLFGETAFALRLPAVIFGVGCIWALYLFGRTVTSTEEALVTVLLLALSYHHVWFSQNARGYTGLLFFSILSSYFFVRARQEHRFALWIGYGFTAALGVYTHITTGFVLAAHFVIHLIELWQSRSWKHARVGLLFGFPFGALLTIQFHALVLPQVFSSMKGTESVVDEWKNPLWTVLEIIRGLNVNFAGVIAGSVACVLFFWGLVSYARSKRVVVELALLPPILGALAVLSVGHHLWPRFFFFAFGFIALIAVRGAMTAGRFAGTLAGTKNMGNYAALAVAALMILVSAISLPRAFGPKQDYQAAKEFVERVQAPGDAVVVAGLANFPLKEYYQATWPELHDEQELDSLRAAYRRVWVIYTLPPVLQAVSPDIYASLQRDFRVVRAFPGTLQHGTVYVCLAEQTGSRFPARSVADHTGGSD